MFDFLRVLCFILAGLAIFYWLYLIVDVLEAIFSRQHRKDMFSYPDGMVLGILTGASLLIGIPALIVLFWH